jgi:carbon monoxide dehydrogenase subunit G
MSKVEVAAESAIGAPAETVYGYLANLQEHQRFLPPAFSDFEVEQGGVGAGSVVRFKVSAGGRERSYRMTVAEPEPGRVLTESDSNSSLVTTFTVTQEGVTARVRISTSWDGATGIGGFFERRFAPRAMRKIYRDELARLNAYATQRSGSGSVG